MPITERDEASGLMRVLTSPIGKKVLTGVTGLGLVVFILEHVLGNLRYFSSDPDAYDKYAHFLLSLGPLIWTLEIGLLVCFLLHAYVGINIYLGKRRARRKGYEKYTSVGAPSRQTISSKTMIYTGLLLLLFLVFHLWSFKYGPGVADGFSKMVAGERMRDFKRLMDIKFNEPLYAFGYPIVMILLGFHLRHGFWSAFQSLGATRPRITPFIYGLGTILAILVAIGFIVLPLYIYFSVPAPAWPTP